MAHFFLAVVIAALAGLMEVFKDDRDRHPFGVGIVTFVLVLPLNFLIDNVALADFSHIITWANFWTFFFDGLLALAVSVCFALAGGNDSAWGGPIASLVCGVVVIVFYVMMATMWDPRTEWGPFCDSTAASRVIGLYNIEESDQNYPDSDLEHLRKVSSDTAIRKARLALGGATNYGAYLEVNRAYLQKVQGHYYYIVDLKLQGSLNWNSFRLAGGVSPGYVVVDAEDPNLDAVPRFNYQMKFIPLHGSWNLWDQDLDRHVYLNVIKGTGLVVDDLDGMEVDDQWNPWYVGTLLRHAVGPYASGMVVDSLVMVSPITGEIKRLSVKDAPAWLDRIWSEELTAAHLKFWGANNKQHVPCSYSNTNGQRVVEEIHMMTTLEGLVYQVTMTSPTSKDHALTEMFMVNPKTGKITRYKASGPNIEAIKHIAEDASRKITSQGYNATSCQLQTMLSRQVWFCVLVGRGLNKEGKEDPLSGGAHSGFAFVQPKYAADTSMVIVTPGGIIEAYNLLREQFATEQDKTGTLARTTTRVQRQGTILRLGHYTVGNQSYVLFTLKGPQDNGTVYYRLSGINPISSLIREGDIVTVTAEEVKFNDFTIVVDVDVPELPNFPKSR